MTLPTMPPTTDRALFDPNEPNGYLEGNGDWADANSDAVTWLADNHAAIRARLEGALTEGQIKALDWMLTVLIEQTAERAPGMQPDQAVEEICDITSIVELLPSGEVHSRLMPQCEEIRREHQVRLDALLAKEAAEPREPLKFEAVVPVTSDMIFHQLISAFEGGVTYWADRVDLISPDQDTLKTDEHIVWWGRTKALYEGEFEIVVTEEEESTAGAGREHKLTPETVQRGIQVMATKYPRHFKDMIEENGDATTGDVFLQCCLFGDIVYG